MITKEDIQKVEDILNKKFSGFLNVSKGFCYCFGDNEDKEVYCSIELKELLKS
jgi:hypothetical protein